MFRSCRADWGLQTNSHHSSRLLPWKWKFLEETGTDISYGLLSLLSPRWYTKKNNKPWPSCYQCVRTLSSFHQNFFYSKCLSVRAEESSCQTDEVNSTRRLKHYMLRATTCAVKTHQIFVDSSHTCFCWFCNTSCLTWRGIIKLWTMIRGMAAILTMPYPTIHTIKTRQWEDMHWSMPHPPTNSIRHPRWCCPRSWQL